MAGNEHIAGVSIGLDPTDFLGGSAKAQDELERLLASFVSASREGQKTVEALAKSLSASPKEVSNALREMDKQDAEMERSAARRRRSAEQSARQQHRLEMQRLKERGQAVSNLRDNLLSLAAISIGGAAGISGTYNAIKGVAQEGASAISFARRTGTDTRTNIGEEKAADLSGVSSANEARSSIASWKRAQTIFETKGQITGPYELVRDAGLDYGQLRGMGHEDFVQAIIKGLRRLRWNDRQISLRLEESGLTSGGYTAFALDSDAYSRFNREGAAQAAKIDPQKELKEAQSFARLENSVGTFRRIVSDDMEPVIDGLGSMVDRLNDVAERHPNAVKDAAIIASGIAGVGAIVALLAPIGAIIGGIRMAATISALKAQLAALEAGTAEAAESVGAGVAEAAGAGLGMTALRAGLRFAGPAGVAISALTPHSLGSDDTFDLSKRPTGLPDGRRIDMERLVGAVGMAESGGKPGQTSPAGAMGLYQLTPATAKMLGVNPNDPAQARAGARRYLEMLERHYHGDTDKTLAAYNSGQGHIDHIVSKFGDNWRDHLTSLENQRYAGRVAAFYRTSQLVRAPSGYAVPMAHASGNTQSNAVHISIQNQTIKANNADEFVRSMGKAANLRNHTIQYNTGQL